MLYDTRPSQSTIRSTHCIPKTFDTGIPCFLRTSLCTRARKVLYLSRHGTTRRFLTHASRSSAGCHNLPLSRRRSAFQFQRCTRQQLYIQRRSFARTAIVSSNTTFPLRQRLLPAFAPSSPIRWLRTRLAQRPRPPPVELRLDVAPTAEAPMPAPHP